MGIEPFNKEIDVPHELPYTVYTAASVNVEVTTHQRSRLHSD